MNPFELAFAYISLKLLSQVKHLKDLLRENLNPGLRRHIVAILLLPA